MMANPCVVLDRIEVLGCTECTRGFLTNADYTLHTLTHTKDNVYKYLKSRNNNSNFIKTFKCEDCDKKFVLKSTLSAHMVLHKPMPHVCECGIGFYEVKNLRAHKVLVHNTKTKTRMRGPWKPVINYTGPKLKIEFTVKTEQDSDKGPKIKEEVKYNSDVNLEIPEIEDEQKSLSGIETDEEFIPNKKAKSKIKPRMKAKLIHKENRKPKNKCQKTKLKPKEKRLKSEYEIKLEAKMIRTVDNKFQCPDCYKIFKGKSPLIIHYRIHTGEKPYKCKICQKSFTQNSTLINHLRVHTGVREYICRHCNKDFSHIENLMRHERIHTGVKPYKCEICSKAFSDPSAYSRHMRIHSGDKRYKCGWCSKGFTDFSGYQMHTKRHTNERNESCNVCSKKFYSKNEVRLHIKSIHAKIKDYECDECGRLFSTKFNLQTHKAYHKKYIFKCDECNANFDLKMKLLKHIKQRHLKKIMCFRCYRVFYSKIDFNRHKLDSCKGRRCRFCTRTFVQVDDLERHVQEMHSKVTFDCDHCESQLSTRSCILRHIKSMHPEFVSKRLFLSNNSR